VVFVHSMGTNPILEEVEEEICRDLCSDLQNQALGYRAIWIYWERAAGQETGPSEE
jgi:hypothetical protein